MIGTYYLGDRKFEVQEMRFSELKAGEILLKVAACGVCGTDVHVYEGGQGSADVNPPVILGHEISGVVDSVGTGVTVVKPGDHVSVDPNIYCGQCHYCRLGKKHLCEHMEAIGVTRDGGFAEYCLVPEEQCYVLDPKLPLAFGAMSEPLACCLHGIDRAQIFQGASVCVIGGGAIGLLMVQLAKLAGAAKIILSEPVKKRQEIGLQMGADHAVDPINEDLPSLIKEFTGVDGVDYVIECAGNMRATESAFEIAKKGATILLFSVTDPDSVYDLRQIDIFQKELTIMGSFINPDTQQRAVDLLNSGKIVIEPIITHKYPVDQVKEAIEMQVSSESIKVIVTP